MVGRKVIILLISIFALILPSCHISRYFYWNLADINDYKKFPAVPVLHNGLPFYFVQKEPQISLNIPDGTLTARAGQSLEDYLKVNKTVAFMVIRNDTVLYERYFYGYDHNSILPSFSVSKSFISALTGIAVEEGYIKSVDQVVTDYLPEMKNPGFRKVRITDLLNMRSGLHFEESYGSPFALMPKFYYGTNLKKYARKLKTEVAADSRYDYQSANTFLLGQIIEKATATPLNIYLQEKIWKPLGMESDASLNTDSKKNNAVKAFCCLNARLHDYAKFGRLYLHHGNWNGKQIIPVHWIQQTQAITKDSKDSGGYSYQYQWRVTKEGNLFAKGILGQYIYVDFKKQIIIVRFGKATGKTDWPSLFKRISDSL